MFYKNGELHNEGLGSKQIIFQASKQPKRLKLILKESPVCLYGFPSHKRGHYIFISPSASCVYPVVPRADPLQEARIDLLKTNWRLIFVCEVALEGRDDCCEHSSHEGIGAWVEGNLPRVHSFSANLQSSQISQQKIIQQRMCIF